MASMNGKEKKELMNRISNRIAREKSSFNSKFKSDDTSAEVLDNMVRQFYEAMDADYFSVEDRIDDELKSFFGEQYFVLGVMEKMVYEIDPSIFKNKVDSLSNKIANEYSICVNSKTEFSSHLDELQKLLSQLKAFVYKNTVNDSEFANNERIKPVIDEANASVDKLVNEIVNLELKNNSLKKNYVSDKNKNSNNDASLLDMYISNLGNSFDSILEVYPDKKVNLVAIGMLLNSLKDNKSIDLATVNNNLMQIRKALLADYGYDIDNNTIISKEDIKEDEKQTLSDKEKSNSGVSDEVDYVSLAATMGSYIKDFEDNQPIILNNDAPGTADDKYKKISTYRDALNGLLKEISDKSRNGQDIKIDFLKLSHNIDKDLWYQYNSNKKGRRRKVVSVKKILLGVGGVAIGTEGISSLLVQLAIFNKFGFAFPTAKPFVIPVCLTIISGIMLKKALTSKEKSIVKNVFEKIKKDNELSLDVLNKDNTLDVESEIDDSIRSKKRR